MKDIVIVNKGNNAAAYCDGVEIMKTGTSNISANLMVLNEVLKSIIPTEPCETYRIFLPELIKGINYGYAIEYVKTGKQQDGKELASDDLAGYKEFYELYKDRVLNIRFNLVSYIDKMTNAEEAKATKALRVKSYSILNKVSSAPATVQTVAIDPNQKLRDMLTEQIMQAISAGDLAKAQSLTEMVKTLGTAPATTAVPTTPVVTNTTTEPKFENASEDLDDIQFCTADINTSEDDEPIVFDDNSQVNIPDWDNSLVQ